MLLSSATGYVLTAYHRADARTGEAGLKYYLLGALTNGPMAYGVVLLFGLGGTTTLDGLADSLIVADRVGLIAASRLVICGLPFKLAPVPVPPRFPHLPHRAPR